MVAAVAMCAFVAADAQGRFARVLKSEVGSIEFEVDTDLPAPEKDLTEYSNDQRNIYRILEEFQIPNDQTNILAYSFEGTKLWWYDPDVMYRTFAMAFADHRPLVLSPDMVWLLISQTFGRYVNENAETMRPLFVDHVGKTDLVVRGTGQDVLHDKDYRWDELFNQFQAELEKNTKGDIAQTITANFSTSGMTERIASQITLMEAMKQYFSFVEFRAACGIPSIILKGTPADWREVEKKVAALDAYGMGWWTRELKPVLKQFTKAAEGRPDLKFWKDIVMEDRPDRVRGGGCSPDVPTEFDGWFLKFFPDTKSRTVPKTKKYGTSAASEMVRVSFLHVNVDDVTGEILDKCDVELFAGFVGTEVDSVSGALTPRIGWMARKSDINSEVADRFSKYSQNFVISEVPEALRGMTYIKELTLNFNTNKVVVPEWMDSIRIDQLTISGNMTEPEAVKLRQRFPGAHVNRSFWNRTLKGKTPTTYRLDSIHGRTDKADRWESFVYDADGHIAEIDVRSISKYSFNTYHRKYVLEYDERGFNTVMDTYSLDSIVPTLYRHEVATYDDDGRLLTHQEYEPMTDSLWLSYESINEYGKDGKLLASTDIHYPRYDESFPRIDTERTEYTYNRKGQNVEELCYDFLTDGTRRLWSVMYYKYNKYGDMISYRHVDLQEQAGPRLIEHRVYERTYKDGREVECVERTTTPSRGSNQTISHRSYDQQGNLVRTEREDSTFFYGGTSYYYDLATPASNVVGGHREAVRPGMAMIEDFLVATMPDTRYRLMLSEGTIAEPRLDTRRTGTEYHYSPVE